MYLCTAFYGFDDVINNNTRKMVEHKVLAAVRIGGGQSAVYARTDGHDGGRNSEPSRLSHRVAEPILFICLL